MTWQRTYTGNTVVYLKKNHGLSKNGPISSNFFGINSFYLLFFIILFHSVYYGTFDGKATVKNPLFYIVSPLVQRRELSQ